MASTAEDLENLKAIKSLKGVEVGPRMRRAFLSGLMEYCNRHKKTIDEVCADWWEQDWKAAGALLTRFMPREVKVDAKHEHTHRFAVMAVPRLNEFLTEITDGYGGADGVQAGPYEITGEAGPVLPAPVSDEAGGCGESVAAGTVPGRTETP